MTFGEQQSNPSVTEHIQIKTNARHASSSVVDLSGSCRLKRKTQFILKLSRIALRSMFRLNTRLYSICQDTFQRLKKCPAAGFELITSSCQSLKEVILLERKRQVHFTPSYKQGSSWEILNWLKARLDLSRLRNCLPMPRGRHGGSFDHVSEFERGRIVASSECELSFREISQRVGRNQATVMS
ncbi:hypothetical protein TNCV_1358171 [Trichonephila clavipes]|uniref:Uncharacterized protein n=1 Tax=Trichonephila clavipes TaxID=2585209 RepID=A0A8X6S8E7_TRICX|nr:hypothetical protein TNCV_1358171 [Trichonephila clavipes]